MTRSKRIPAMLASLVAGLLSVAPAAAQDGPVEIDALIEARGIVSDLVLDQGEGIDSSGAGVRGRIGMTYRPSERTQLRAEAEGRVFEFADADGQRLDTVIGRLEIGHQLTETIAVEGFARRFENISLLEALSGDQTSLGGRLQWQRGDDRLRATGEYRKREYDTAVGGSGEGWRAALEYNRRLGSYHYVRFDLAIDRNDSDDEPRRSYDRRVASVLYSHPIGRRIRLRPRLEYREWDYDARIARGDPNAALREDSYVAPGIDLAWGRENRGIYGEFDFEYRFRRSNDERFDDNAARGSVRLGYRF